MKSETEIQAHLDVLNGEYDWLVERFLLAEKDWAREAYTRTLAEISSRRATLKWVLSDSPESEVEE